MTPRPDHCMTAYWQTEPGIRRAALTEDVTVDVAIVGGGVGGLAAAWHLADRGLGVAVVEARSVAAGASGRSGGFLIAGAAPMYNDARERLGADLARRIYAGTLAAQRQIYAVADEIRASRCFRKAGLLRLGIDEDESAHVRRHARALAEDGFPGSIVELDDLPARLRRPGRAGLSTSHDASVHPVRWLRALAAALERRGVAIYEHTTGAIGPGVVSGGHGGRLRCGAVVVAADAAVGALVPEYAGRVRPRRLHMVATAPLPVAGVEQPVYARYGYEYHQQLPDGRVLLGGFSDLDGDDSYTDREVASAAVLARLGRYLAEELGLGAPITHHWVGIVGYTVDGRPFAGAVPGREGLYAMGGYCGTGNVCGWLAGRIVAELISSGASVDADLFDAAR